MLSEKLIAFNKGRLPNMVQLKYEAMCDNAFRFFRGTCHLFYQQLQGVKTLPASPLVWICGDLHLENFGSFKGGNNLVYFDLNDFDEGMLAPALWEVLRLITSIFVAFGALELGEDQAANLAVLFVNTYAKTLCKGKAMDVEPRTAKGIVKKFLKHAENRCYTDLLEKRTKLKGKKVVLSLAHERHFKVDKTLKQELIAHISHWIATSSESPYNYKVKDVVFRVAGTGSLGVKRYLFLLKSTRIKDNYLLLDMKQSLTSSLLPYLNVKQPHWVDEAQRIVDIQERMQHVSSSLLGTTSFAGEAYVVQELQPMEDTFDFKLASGNYRNLIQVIDDMATLTAAAQLRSGGMDGSASIDALKAFGADRLNWSDEVLRLAKAAALQNTHDYQEFMTAYQKGIFSPKNKTHENTTGK